MPLQILITSNLVLITLISIRGTRWLGNHLADSTFQTWSSNFALNESWDVRNDQYTPTFHPSSLTSTWTIVSFLCSFFSHLLRFSIIFSDCWWKQLKCIFENKNVKLKLKRKKWVIVYASLKEEQLLILGFDFWKTRFDSLLWSFYFVSSTIVRRWRFCEIRIWNRYWIESQTTFGDEDEKPARNGYKYETGAWGSAWNGYESAWIWNHRYWIESELWIHCRSPSINE